MVACLLSLLLCASAPAEASDDTADTADPGAGLVELAGEPGGCGCSSGDLAAPLVAVLLGFGALRRRKDSAR
jgi:MYXO-CTERM domain-containing protein